ncbi:MAG: type I glyceraldehyde-3-phosphate dehydrogenase [Alphaproteobacteria bacterium]|nr:type I glyceraldehyde-3-phosphate dehydrogenase [Alphaproteobacteria bacterium]
MAVKVGINGFGRIGRMVLRALVESKRVDIDIVAINDLAPFESSIHLLRYDSVHGPFGAPMNFDEQTQLLSIQHRTIKILSESNPAAISWKDLGVDIVLECSGVFTNKEKASAHLVGGAKKVLISAPADNVDRTVVYGVNHTTLEKTDIIVSNASCTTNCLAPMVKVLDDLVGVTKGYMTTIHSYTGDQRLIDTNHKDLRRARAGALNMIPTSTGAAKAVGLVIPSMQGKLDGVAIRVPTPNVSMIDFKFVSDKNTTVQALNNAFILAETKGPLVNVLGAVNLPLVSSDFNHNPLSSIVDLTQTSVVQGNLCRVVSWYDNEWGFSNRMLDVAAYMGGL